MAKDPAGKWEHTTIFKVPAHTLITVTVYQYDGASGLRNSFLSGVSGTTGDVEVINGKPQHGIDPNNAAHTFTIPGPRRERPPAGGQPQRQEPVQCGALHPG
jgi:hypothetical protein